jgi:hypothetical protein
VSPATGSSRPTGGAELRKRSLRLYRAAHGPLTAAADTAMAVNLAAVWLQFRAHRAGPAERIGDVA